MSEKMCRKLKEKQVERARKNSGDTYGQQQAEEHRQEVEALRAELEKVPTESVKWV